VAASQARQFVIQRAIQLVLSLDRVELLLVPGESFIGYDCQDLTVHLRCAPNHLRLPVLANGDRRLPKRRRGFLTQSLPLPRVHDQARVSEQIRRRVIDVKL
jgi:hypothetical protein